MIKDMVLKCDCDLYLSGPFLCTVSVCVCVRVTCTHTLYMHVHISPLTLI